MSDLRFCPACGMQLPRVAGVPVRFCPGCGVRLESVEDDPGVAEPANGAAADDGAGEGYEPSVNAPVDVPMQDADAASPVRDVAAADAPHVGDLELHTACDASGGQALAQVALPRGWRIEEAHLERSSSFDCPISVGVTAAGRRANASCIAPSSATWTRAPLPSVSPRKPSARRLCTWRRRATS